MPINPWRLRLLSLLESHGTVRAVAQAEHLSPSTVSQQLKALEAEVRAPLLERTGRHVALTPAGVTLAARAREILAGMDAAQTELDGLGSQPVGTVRLAAFASAMRSLALPAAGRLAAALPGIDVVLSELEPHESLPALLRGKQDVIVTADFSDAGSAAVPGVLRTPLCADDVVLVTSPAHRLATARHTGGVDLGALAGERWALDVPGTYLADLVTRACRRAGFEPRVAGRFADHGLVLQQIEAGLAVALLPTLAVDDRYRVHAHPLRDPVRRHLVGATRTSGGRRAVREVLAALRAQGSGPDRHRA